jgi:excisionase family DNA binding protein
MRKVQPAPPEDWVKEIVEPLASLVTMEETMVVLRCSRRTLTRLLSSGRIHSVRRNGGCRQLIPRSSIAEYLRGLEGAA